MWYVQNGVQLGDIRSSGGYMIEPTNPVYFAPSLVVLGSWTALSSSIEASARSSSIPNVLSHRNRRAVRSLPLIQSPRPNTGRRTGKCPQSFFPTRLEIAILSPVVSSLPSPSHLIPSHPHFPFPYYLPPFEQPPLAPADGYSPGGVALASKQGQLEKGHEAATFQKVPWYRTRRGVTAIVIALVLVIVVIIGGAVGGSKHHSHNPDDDNSRTGGGVGGNGSGNGTSAAPSISGGTLTGASSTAATTASLTGSSNIFPQSSTLAATTTMAVESNEPQITVGV